jgi:hypothetical protein
MFILTWMQVGNVHTPQPQLLSPKLILRGWQHFPLRRRLPQGRLVARGLPPAEFDAARNLASLHVVSSLPEFPFLVWIPESDPNRAPFFGRDPAIVRGGSSLSIRYIYAETEKIGDLPFLVAGFAGLSVSLSCPPQLIWLRSFALWRIFTQIHLDFEPD